MAQASFAPAKAEFEKLRTAKAEPATPSHKPILGPVNISGTVEAMTGSVGGAGVGLLSQEHHLPRLVGQPFAIFISPQGVSRFPQQYYVSASNSPSGPSN